jgi:hypothetical protein
VITVTTPGTVTDVNVTLFGVTHTYPADIEALLVGPSGADVILMANASDGTPVSGIDLTFDDQAPAQLPEEDAMVGGIYQPSNFYDFTGPAPAPAAPFGASLSVFDGTASDGDWQLFLVDDGTGDVGTIQGGWSLDLTYIPASAVTGFQPLRGGAGDPVVVTGSGFTGTTAVAFGDTPATAFTVDSDTQITASVPAGATTAAITVTSPTGVASTDRTFIVTHDRTLSISVAGTHLRGLVKAADDDHACVGAMPVKLQHLDDHRWRTIAKVTTGTKGSYRGSTDGLSGRFRSVAPKTTASSGDVCLLGTSPVVHG